MNNGFSANIQCPADSPALLQGAARAIVEKLGSDEQRYHHLDALRGFALLLGVLFHAAESFGPNNYYWAVVDQSSTQLLEDLRFAAHSFRMELFFVIAGFFARLLLKRRGVTGFIANRTQRILMPLVVGWLVMYPVLVLIWIWGQSVSGRLGDFGVPPEMQNTSVWLLWIGFFLTGGFLQKFDLTHLWFLHQLLVLYALFLGSRWLWFRARESDARTAFVARSFERINRSRAGLLWFAIPTIPIMLLMRTWSVDTPKESLLPHLPTTILFGFCFCAGWLWHRQPALLDYSARRWVWHLLAGVLIWLNFGWFDETALRRMAPEQLRWMRLGFMTLYSLINVECPIMWS